MVDVGYHSMDCIGSFPVNRSESQLAQYWVGAHAPLLEIPVQCSQRDASETGISRAQAVIDKNFEEISDKIAIHTLDASPGVGWLTPWSLRRFSQATSRLHAVCEAGSPGNIRYRYKRVPRLVGGLTVAPR